MIWIRNLPTNSKKYPTQLTVTLQNCSNVLEESVCHFSSRFCTIFGKFNHCAGSTRGKATRATCTVVSFAKNSAKTTRNVTHTPPKHYYNLVM